MSLLFSFFYYTLQFHYLLQKLELQLMGFEGLFECRFFLLKQHSWKIFLWTLQWVFFHIEQLQNVPNLYHNAEFISNYKCKLQVSNVVMGDMVTKTLKITINLQKLFLSSTKLLQNSKTSHCASLLFSFLSLSQLWQKCRISIFYLFFNFYFLKVHCQEGKPEVRSYMSNIHKSIKK